ncbi:hypothetical protein VNO78_36386 [Psophocarpus tetragonolobus]|uniref:Uncharacterized protein n=1 Tax=Psophocarpus tetragonolobus TaxID=3891 RepID=A0AAN9NIW5_PSOTE
MPRLGTAVIHSFIVGCCSLSRKKEKDPEKKEVGFGSIWDRTILFSLAVSSQFSDPRGTLACSDQRGGQKEFSSFRAGYEDMVGAFIDSLAPTGSLTNVPVSVGDSLKETLKDACSVSVRLTSWPWRMRPVRKIGFGARLLRRRIWSLCSLQVEDQDEIRFLGRTYKDCWPGCVKGAEARIKGMRVACQMDLVSVAKTKSSGQRTMALSLNG